MAEKLRRRMEFREAQDEWAYRSHQRAVSAHKEGRFEEEIVPVTIPQRKGILLSLQRMRRRVKIQQLKS